MGSGGNPERCTGRAGWGFVLHMVFIIIAVVRAGNGEYYRYPLTIRFVK